MKTAMVSTTSRHPLIAPSGLVQEDRHHKTCCPLCAPVELGCVAYSDTGMNDSSLELARPIVPTFDVELWASERQSSRVRKCERKNNTFLSVPSRARGSLGVAGVRVTLLPRF
ncbi:hypothetical protein PHBOTO_000879 [Pseudozyma hubeiensis]|nr:hypothetical protein PHBOTO_000879 [Pseudozyma hubeiensis]